MFANTEKYGQAVGGVLFREEKGGGGEVIVYGKVLFLDVGGFCRGRSSAF